jgi:hypothetical protein
MIGRVQMQIVQLNQIYHVMISLSDGTMFSLQIDAQIQLHQVPSASFNSIGISPQLMNSSRKISKLKSSRLPIVEAALIPLWLLP